MIHWHSSLPELVFTAGKFTEIVDAYLPPEARVFELLCQSSADVFVSLRVDLRLQILPDAVHLFHKGDALIVAMLEFLPEQFLLYGLLRFATVPLR